AGMMAAGRAGELGARVILLEKNSALGMKLLITGHGRCNITNKIDEPKDMARMYGRNGRFLLPLLYMFGVRDVVDFFESRGVRTKVEKGNRVLCESDRAEDVLGALIKYLNDSQVEVKVNAEVKEVVRKGNLIEKVVLASREEIIADKFIVCTGGKSYPATGSTGDGYGWAKLSGHTIVTPLPSLTPIVLKEGFVKELEGLSLKDAIISLYKDEKKIDSGQGDALFTANGMSGPAIINMSRSMHKALPGKISLKIDLIPDLDFKGLDLMLWNYFQEGANRLFKNSLDKFVPQKLVPIIAKLSEIDLEKKSGLVTKEERKRLVHLLKEFSLEVKGLAGFDKAVITAGGIELSEIEPKTMRSKLVKNLYFAGEILDLDGPTGGYNLQVCWSTGYAAGQAASLKQGVASGKTL
ncbi:MAG: NAD(P)/FAD-dependent oxidoreductase, partial [Thermodesulfobacteriota bacterium]